MTKGGTTVKRENILCKLNVLVLALIVSVAIIPQVSYAKEKPALTKTEVAIGKKKSIDINIKNKVKGSRYKWTSSNEEVATVNEKGVITGKKGGDAVIICTVTTPAGKVYKLSCDVSINTKSKVTVFNQKDLEKALADKDVQQIIIKTKTGRKFVIPENDYTDKRLYIKAPNAEIENNGSFKSVHAYVSNQAELEKALAYDKVTIITIETKNKVKFTIEGNYSNIRLIVNAPNAQVVTKAIFRKVDITAVKEIESKDYDKTTEDSLIGEQGEETKVNNEKQQNNENNQDENSLNKNDEKQENAGNTGNAGNAAGGFPVDVGPVFPGNTGENDGTDTPKPEPLPGTGGDSGNEENPGAKPGETSTPETDEKAGDNPTPGTDVKPGETPTPETDEKPGETPTPETDEKAGETPTPGTDVKPGETPTPETDEKPEETPTSGTDPKSEETPSSGSDSETGKEDLQLKKAKEDAIAAIYKEAEKYKSKLNNKELNDFNDMLQYYINVQFFYNRIMNHCKNL